MKALVVGAGIGGLSTAIALGQAGVDVTVLERRADLNEILIGGGIVLWPNAMKALKELGLADEVDKVGVRVTRSFNRSHRGELLARIPLGDFQKTHGTIAVAVSRPNLHNLLEGKLHEGAVRLNTEVTGFTQDGSGVTAQLAGGGEERADFMISADGRNSRLRSQVVETEGTYPGYAGYTHWSGVVPLQHSAAPQGVFGLMTGPGGQFYYFHIEPNSVYWAGIQFIPEGGKDPEGGHKAAVLQYFGSWADPVRPLVDATPEAEIVRRDLHGGLPLPRWGNGRVSLLGDAAHPMSVTLGQGAAMAIEDSVALKRRLAAGGDLVAALRAYEDERLERTAAFMKVARSFDSRSGVRNPIRCWIRDRFIKLAFSQPRILHRMGYYQEMNRAV